jgi:polygalacturonase
LPENYPKDPGRHERGSDPSITDADARFLGEFMTFSRLLFVDGATDVHIRGRGTIDADGSFLRKERNAVPNVVRVKKSDQVTIEDVMIRDSAAWTVHLLGASHVDITNLKILNDRTNLNTDGIDVDSSSNVTIDRAFIYTKDDGVCLKGSNNSDVLGDVDHVVVTNSVVSSIDAALKLGTESQSGVFRNVRFENHDVFDSDRAMSIVVRDGARYENIVYRDIRVGSGVQHLVEQVIGDRRDRAVVLGRITNLVFENIDAPEYTTPASNWTWYAQFRPDRPKQGDRDVAMFSGADDAHAVDGLTFRNVRVRGEVLESAEHATRLANISFGSSLRNVRFD